MTILVRIKNVYGTELIYPADEQAQKFIALTGKKTFDRRDLRLIRELGFDVTVEVPTL